MEEKLLKRRFLTAAVLVAVAAALLFGGVATYAWFTSNQRVSTSRIETRTGDEEVELLVSSTGGADFKGASEAAITQINKANAEYLMPVSTADLTTFVTPTARDESGYPVSYAVMTEEANYYHGRVWLRANARGAAAGSRMALYLDETAAAGGILAKKSDDNSLLLNAARLGLALESGERVIFRLSEETNAENARQRNTTLNGVLQEEGIVLDGSGSSIVAVNDPAVPISSRALQEGGSLGAPLGYLELGKIYALDVYFYLEGCDPDCWDSIYFDAADLRLAFYGVLS